MKYKLGEFVRFVEERREGYITRIIDDQTIAVTDDDGFEIPVLAAQVTRVHGKESDGESNTSTTSIIEQSGDFKKSGVYLAVVNDNKAGSVVHIHLVNSTSYQLLATLFTEKASQFKGEFSGAVKPDSSQVLFSANLNELDQWPKFHLQILPFASSGDELPKALIFTEKFRGKDFSGAKKQLSQLNQPAWLIQVDSNAPIIDAQKLKESFHKPASEKPQIENPGKEIDLHIEKLRDDYQFLNGNEILQIQLNHFRKSLDAATVHKLPSIIFIHGSGNGTLRNEIHKAVSKHIQVKTFMDAYREKFGYGATEVVFK